MSLTPGSPDDPALDVELVAAALRADTADLEIYAQVLTGALADALPAGMVSVARERSLSDRLGGRPGRVAAISVVTGDTELRLSPGRGLPVANVCTRVRGVTISTKEISVEDWVRRLATVLAEAAARSAAARAALAKLVTG